MSEPLQLPGRMVVGPTAADVHETLAARFFEAAMAAVKDRGVFHVALSGGSTPEPLYELLVVDPRYRLLPWRETHIWLVDERRVPETDDKSNFKMINETLITHVPARKRGIHPMPVLSESPAQAYEADLRECLGDDGQLDLVLLGMGDDAHTASLFPESEAVNEDKAWVAINEGPKVTPPPRLTMTYPLINAAREVVVLVTGSKKAPTLADVNRQLREQGPDIARYPITGVQPSTATLTWYLDAEAAGEDTGPAQIELT